MFRCGSEYRRRSKLMSRLRVFAARIDTLISRSPVSVCRCSSPPSITVSKFRTSRAERPAFLHTKRVVDTSGSTYKEAMLRVWYRTRPLSLVVVVLVAVTIFAVGRGDSSAQSPLPARREVRVGVAGVPAALDPIAALDGVPALLARQVFD